MGKIVAIGGGELRLKETMLIDKYIVEFSENPNPNLLFIPTASGEGFTFSGDLATDAVGLLIHHGRRDVAEHVLQVAGQAQSIAARFNVDTGHEQTQLYSTKCCSLLTRCHGNQTMLYFKSKSVRR